MPDSETLPWRDPQPRPVGYEEHPRRSAYKGHSFRLVLEPVDGPQYSVIAVVAFLIALGVLVAVIAIKASSLLLAATGSTAPNPYDGLASTIVLWGLVVVAIVLGHIGLSQVHKGVRRGLVMSGFTLGVGYSLCVVGAILLANQL